MFVSVPQDKRPTDAKDLQKFEESCVEGLPKKFSFLGTRIENDKQLVEAYNFQWLVKDLMTKVSKDDTIEAFEILTDPEMRSLIKRAPHHLLRILENVFL